MPKFLYKARDRRKINVTGIIEADSESSAARKLTEGGFFPYFITAEREKRENIYSRYFGRIGARDLGIFTRQLSDLLDSGLSLLEAFNVLSSQTENPALKAMIDRVTLSLKDGKMLSEAMSEHSRVFSQLYVSMVRSGELGGMLDNVLKNLADFSENESEVRSKISAAMAYPVLIAAAGLGTIVFLLTFVIPKLVGMFEEMGQVLPLPTRVLIIISGIFLNFWWLILLFVLFAAFILNRASKTKEGKAIIGKFKLALPILGVFTEKVELTRFSRTLGTLVHNGVPLLDALGVVAEITAVEPIKRDIVHIQEQVREGAKLTAGMKKSKFFPPFVVNMIAVGEESGALEESLGKVANSYDREIERSMKMLTSLLEPVMILVMGGIVGFIVISMLLPIFQINLAIR
ncbi:MAG: hypothetical protein AUJ75_02910 [Candidatus Omnitrophica bacterium CG1_02_49_10]|nr:MAG: hypothetical protein AUJ75_02910 [Candidatus Omnitrophica bacterium CG1_02_49_10]